MLGMRWRYNYPKAEVEHSKAALEEYRANKNNSPEE